MNEENQERQPLLGADRGEPLPVVLDDLSGSFSGQGPNSTGSRFEANHMSYLAYLRDGSSEHLPMENPVTLALKTCNDRVLKPYRRLLLFVGWEPWFEYPSHCWQKTLNLLSPVIVMLFVLMGYIIQYATCFRRDSFWHSPYQNGTGGCENVIVSRYIIPDILHSVAYIYSFYLLRIAQSEQLPMLMERVFLQTSPTQTGFLSQGKLIRVLTLLLYMCVVWVLLSLAAQIIHVKSEYELLHFTFLAGSKFEQILLLVLMLLSFLFLDIVYTAVVINYCAQCCLLLFYIEGLQEKLKRKLIELSVGIKEMAEIQKHLNSLNYTTAIALSIVLFNFGTMAFSGTVELLIPTTQWTVMRALYTVLSVVFWISLMLLPIIQAARLTAAGNSLRKVGHVLRVEPFLYQDISTEELDSFLLYTTSLTLTAKIFLTPVRTSYLTVLAVVFSFILLLLFQTEALHIWL